MRKHDKEQTAEVEKVACEVCLNKIPVSEAKSAEATDYVAYFCGLDCYDKWKHQKSSDKS
ncbi:MAG: DUF3330 domain-containing protein [gamma proteobacterium symbiont of Lucinoma myriamae]|nr:DUF3330 domain-containing protein [gamma proteobacterium symbiont of Lucinoma myriamae]MCU7817395.1 DUF3330 domain-containing protein [gamma proteobacterium symbiont of Lucinoma myriamae]MCU7832848.1 DUF3330 domain-containing protein [gamma proteobacterium symbiont of Lucinoma myriamae]